MAKDNPDNGDELRKLYFSFAKAIDEGSDLMDFSSDDLLDVFDYALRGNDEAIAGEAVIEGLRRAPGNLDFVKRKGFLFHEIDNDEACERIFMQLPETEFVRIALLLRNSASLSNIDDLFRQRLASVNDFTVEEWDIVFLVDIFDTIDKIEVLQRNINEISRVSQIPEAIYSELYNLLYEKGRFSDALEIGKMLCDVNAFDVEAWTELANLYLMKFGDAESAIESAEYALAIDPDNLTALMLKAIALHDSDHREARNIVSDALRNHPDESIVLFASGCIEFLDDNEAIALARLNDSFPGFSRLQRREAMDLALRYIKSLENSAEVVRNLTLLLHDDSDLNCEEWLERLNRSGCYVGACCLISAALKVNALDTSMLSVVTGICEALYHTGQFAEIKRFINEIYSDSDTSFILMPSVVMLIYATALYRLGEMAELRAFLKQAISFTKDTPRGINVNERIFLRANHRLLVRMGEQIDRLPLPPEESLFDPFLI